MDFYLLFNVCKRWKKVTRKIEEERGYVRHEQNLLTFGTCHSVFRFLLKIFNYFRQIPTIQLMRMNSTRIRISSMYIF